MFVCSVKVQESGKIESINNLVQSQLVRQPKALLKLLWRLLIKISGIDIVQNGHSFITRVELHIYKKISRISELQLKLLILLKHT
jgi:hypothetical protein